jgi:hypothetical protein
MIFAEMVLESERERDKSGVAVSQSQQCSSEMILLVGHISLCQDRKPLL